ncbi:MAG: pirin-like C-terminal cupin domain-containing protein, partial [Gallionella sp.]
LDIHMPAGSEYSPAIPASHNAFIYVYRGAVAIDGKRVAAQRMGILSNMPNTLGVALSAVEDTRLILLAGRPLNEPIVQYGPFVMNTQQQIHQALNDFRAGQLA